MMPPALEALAQDTRYALRSMRRHGGLSTVIVLTLALAIGANTAIFTLLDGLLLRSLPVRDPQSLLLLHWTAHHRPSGIHGSSSYGDCETRYAPTHAESCSFSVPFYRTVEQQSRTLAEVTAFAGRDALNLTGRGPASIAHTQWVAGNYFQTLGLTPRLGRFLQPGDDTAGAPPAAVISYDYWQHQFGGAPGVVGQVITLNQVPVTVVGVAGAEFTGLTPGSTYDGWLPLSLRARLDPHWTPDRLQASSIWMVLLARLRPGVSVTQAQSELNGLFHDAMFNGASPLAVAADAPRLQMLPAQAALNGDRGDYRPPLLILMGIVAAILLIACTNIAGLLLGRAHARHKELALRRALGAGSGRILRQLLTESLVLALAGGFLGLGLGWAGARELRVMLLGGRDWQSLIVGLDSRVLLFTLAATVVTGLLFGLAPALRGLRGDLNCSLKDATGNSAATSHRRSRRRPSCLAGGKIEAEKWGFLPDPISSPGKDFCLPLCSADPVAAGGSRPSGGVGGAAPGKDRLCLRWRGLHLGNGLVVAQIAVCLVVLAGAGLLVRTLQNLRHVDPGFDTQNLLLFSLDPSSLGYKGAPVLTLYDRIQQQIAALPGVRRVSYSESAMISGSLSDTGFQLDPGPNGRSVDADWMPIGLHWFSTMGMKLLTGRDFDPRDFVPAVRNSSQAQANARPPRNVIVNQEFVSRFLTDGRVLGRALGYRKDGGHPQYVIVGVVSNARYESLRAPLMPTMYAPLNEAYATFEVRTAADPMAMLPAVTHAVHGVEQNLPLVRPITQTETIDQMLTRESMVAKLAAIFGGLALLLAAIGLYGLLAQEVTRRTREIGIRMALGAERRQVLRLIFGLGSLLTLLGLALGLAGAWGATRYLGTMLYGVQAGDPVTLAMVGAILVVVALAACLLPARRATQVDPMVALRYE